MKENKIKLHSNRIRERSRRNLFNAHDSEVEWEKEILDTVNLLNTENSPRKPRRKLTGQKYTGESEAEKQTRCNCKENHRTKS